MSREKAASILALSDVDRAVYVSKRNQRSYWQRLSHSEWVDFCAAMGQWLTQEAPNEWDDFVIANKARKAASDVQAEANRPFPRKPKK